MRILCHCNEGRVGGGGVGGEGGLVGSLQSMTFFGEGWEGGL